MLNYSTYNTDDNLSSFIRRYNKNKIPIKVDFRNLVKCLRSQNRATHLIHTYPAKLLMHIPFYFLANNVLSAPGDLTLDPFAGSGTVLLESQLSGRKAIGAEINPLARLVCRVKTNPINSEEIERSTQSLFKKIPKKPKELPPDVTNLNYWFYPHIIKQLQRVREGINEICNPDLRDFFLVCFSNCLRKVSLADPRVYVPVRLRVDQYEEGHYLQKKVVKHLNRLRRINVIKLLMKIIEMNRTRMEVLTKYADSIPKADIICSDAKSLKFEFSDNGNIGAQLPEESVQLIITSPPYPGAQKYIRSSSLSLGWLGLCSTREIPKYKYLTIGREEVKSEEYCEKIVTDIKSADLILENIFEINPKRAAIAGLYLTEMRDVIAELYRVLKVGGYLVLVAANNKICGINFKTQEYLRQLAVERGFKEILLLVDDIKSRGLMLKRNSTANIITREWVMVFQKG